MRSVILAAGKGIQSLYYDLNDPIALKSINEGKTVIDLLLKSFTDAGINENHLVSGYHSEKFIEYSDRLNIHLNDQWRKTNSFYSLYIIRELFKDEKDTLICYSDTVFTQDLINKAVSDNKNITISIDKSWLKRYEGRGAKLIYEAEKVIATGNQLISIKKGGIENELIQGEFTGLLFVPKKYSIIFKNAIDTFPKVHKNAFQSSYIDFINFLNSNCQIGVKGIIGKWAELDAPQDLAQFVFGTKAETLFRLGKEIRKAKIQEQISFSVIEWKKNRTDIIKKIKKGFKRINLVVRSSAIGEDSFENSMAGKFKSILRVDSTSDNHIEEAIDEVVNSYRSNNEFNQCLVQPFVENVIMSGVVFTRDIESGAPYYILNYDESNKTDSITSGKSRESKLFIQYKKSKYLGKNTKIEKLIEVIKEVEEIVGFDYLDLEFAIDKDNHIYILQTRPLVANSKTKHYSDVDFHNEIRSIQEFVHTFFNESDELCGKINILANMPDWNPAEIIGTTPKLLSSSLYRYLITDEVWRIQRAEFGYKNVFPNPLMLLLSGQPYIDVRSTFMSFIPQSLNEKLTEKLLSFYLGKLRSNTFLHDKVEFEIVFSCFTFDLKSRMKELLEFGFTNSEIDTIKNELIKITSKWINSTIIKDELEKVEALVKLMKESNKKRSLYKSCFDIFNSLEHCKKNGTLPFAKLARCGFIGTELIKSLVRSESISLGTYNKFFTNLNTISKQFTNDKILFDNGVIAKKDFIRKYGHLRPGTYDICSLRYDSPKSNYFRKNDRKLRIHRTSKKESIKVRSEIINAIDAEIKISKIDISAESIYDFCVQSIEAREYSKFLFTKILSDVLEKVARIGDLLDISREELSYVSIEKFIMNRMESMPSDFKESLMMAIEKNQIRHSITKAIKLPNVILNANDVNGFFMDEGRPNYITQKSIVGRVAVINEVIEIEKLDLRGKIIIIQNADPGYDWLFSHEILGLITIYGGVNSHMAIRAAEHNLPSAIGCGDKIWESIKKASVVQLDCSAEKINVLEY